MNNRRRQDMREEDQVIRNAGQKRQSAHTNRINSSSGQIHTRLVAVSAAVSAAGRGGRLSRLNGRGLDLRWVRSGGRCGRGDLWDGTVSGSVTGASAGGSSRGGGRRLVGAGSLASRGLRWVGGIRDEGESRESGRGLGGNLGLVDASRTSRLGGGLEASGASRVGSVVADGVLGSGDSRVSGRSSLRCGRLAGVTRVGGSGLAGAGGTGRLAGVTRVGGGRLARAGSAGGLVGSLGDGNGLLGSNGNGDRGSALLLAGRAGWVAVGANGDVAGGSGLHGHVLGGGGGGLDGVGAGGNVTGGVLDIVGTDGVSTGGSRGGLASGNDDGLVKSRCAGGDDLGGDGVGGGAGTDSVDEGLGDLGDVLGDGVGRVDDLADIVADRGGGGWGRASSSGVQRVASGVDSGDRGRGNNRGVLYGVGRGRSRATVSTVGGTA